MSKAPSSFVLAPDTEWLRDFEHELDAIAVRNDLPVVRSKRSASAQGHLLYAGGAFFGSLNKIPGRKYIQRLVASGDQKRLRLILEKPAEADLTQLGKVVSQYSRHIERVGRRKRPKY